MRAPSANKSDSVYQVQADINVTPLVDVMLVLLVVFMITAPMLAVGLHVNLPQASAAAKLDPKPPVVLTYSKDGRIDLDGQDYALDQILAAIQAKLGDNKTQPIHLRADRETPYGDLVGLMDLLASHGLTRLAILTGPATQPDAFGKAPASPAASP